MKMKKKHIGLLTFFAVVAVLFPSCKPDVNITSDYKETTVVYGLLNPLDNYQYIKIYKGYLTKDNALVYAQNLDYISYYNKIKVQLVEYDLNGNYRYTYTLDTVMSVPKELGTFAAPTQVLYRMKQSLHEGYHYCLLVTDKDTGDTIVTAETKTIRNMTFNVPLGTAQSISPLNLNNENPWYVGYKPESTPENAVAIDAYLTFRYIEKHKRTGAVIHKAVSDIRMTTGFVNSNQTMFKPNTVYKILSEHIQPNDSVVRYVDNYFGQGYACIDIKLWACDNTYYQYYKIAQPSSSIVQDRVAYTNIVAHNGGVALGFFASRTYYERHFKIDVNQHNEDSLISGQWTKNLGFRPYTEYAN